ncbi:copper homeostasis protein CutC [Streptomyces sp. NBC_01276]|uniref:copper homeostasis protein CutC n=1 Tax=Streptomyces sp. NBC_01276 TaxID=2903808 RepID=UPI00352F1129
MREPVLEVVVTSVEEAVAAVAGGANRLEVATDMAADGMTPDLADFRRVRDSVSVPLRVMLRDHGGFRAADPDRLREAASALRAAGADAFVLGFLTPGGTLDLPAVTSVLSAVPGCRWTFHRAMDHAADRAAVRRALRGLPGLDTVLTAGSVTGVADGLDVLLSESAVLDPDGPGTGTGTGTGVCVMAGGGLLPRHVPALRAHGVDAFHVGTSVRHGGWGTPVDPAAVSRWRRLVESAAVEPGVLEPPVPESPGEESRPRVR